MLLLFLLVLAGTALATLGTQWQQAAQRERETELLFRGQQITEALRRYSQASAPGQPTLPATLHELLDDRRGPVPRHHLRRLFVDPFTGQADWLLLRNDAGGILGVHSQSRQPALRSHALPVRLAAPAPGTAPSVGDWRFQIESGAAVAAEPAIRTRLR